jgi:hypothetical protein
MSPSEAREARDNVLPPPERGHIAREGLACATSYGDKSTGFIAFPANASPSSFANNLSRLRSLTLVTYPGKGNVRAEAAESSSQVAIFSCWYQLLTAVSAAQVDFAMGDCRRPAEGDIVACPMRSEWL